MPDVKAVETLKKVSVTVKVNAGTDSEGNVKFANINLPNLSETNYDADKALAIVSALAPCISKTIAGVEQTKVNTLSAA